MQDNFANRLRKILTIRNIKPAELAEKSGVPKSAISQYLSGLYEAKQKNIDKLSKALDINEAWLMGHDVPMERNLKQQYNNNEYVIDTSGLTKKDIEQVKRFIEFIKKEKKGDK